MPGVQIIKAEFYVHHHPRTKREKTTESAPDPADLNENAGTEANSMRTAKRRAETAILQRLSNFIVRMFILT